MMLVINSINTLIFCWIVVAATVENIILMYYYSSIWYCYNWFMGSTFYYNWWLLLILVILQYEHQYFIVLLLQLLQLTLDKALFKILICTCKKMVLHLQEYSLALCSKYCKVHDYITSNQHKSNSQTSRLWLLFRSYKYQTIKK